VFVEGIEQTRFGDFGFFPQRDNPALRARKAPPIEEMQLAGPEHGGLVVAEWYPEVENGNSGSKVGGL
jgi:hypothetical protein